MFLSACLRNSNKHESSSTSQTNGAKDGTHLLFKPNIISLRTMKHTYICKRYTTLTFTLQTSTNRISLTHCILHINTKHFNFNKDRNILSSMSQHNRCTNKIHVNHFAFTREKECTQHSNDLHVKLQFKSGEA